MSNPSDATLKASTPASAPNPTPKPADGSASAPSATKPARAAKPLNGSARNARHNGSLGPADEAPDQFEPELTEDQLRKVKTGLKKKDLDEFRKLLLEDRAELIGDIEGLDGARTNYGGELANVPLHMADAGSENFDREFMLGMAEHSRKKLRLINEALSRLDKGFYGVCLDSGKPIERARLEFEPWTRYSIEVARHRERLGLTD
jgi:DnaK suppressor protein